MNNDVEIAVLKEQYRKQNELLEESFEKIFSWQSKHDEDHKKINDFMTATNIYIYNNKEIDKRKLKIKDAISTGTRLAFYANIFTLLANIIFFLITWRIFK